jgi:hypothetical protein
VNRPLIDSCNRLFNLSGEFFSTHRLQTRLTQEIISTYDEALSVCDLFKLMERFPYYFAVSGPLVLGLCEITGLHSKVYGPRIRLFILLGIACYTVVSENSMLDQFYVA